MMLERTIAENAWQVEEGLFRILLPLKWDVPFVNVYVVRSRDECMLIDCGLNWPTGLRALGRALKIIGVKPQGLTTIALTHRHPDHAGGAQAVQKRWGGRVMIHPADMGLFYPTPEQQLEWGRTHGLDEARLAQLAKLRREPPDALPENVEPLLPGQEVRVGDLSFEVIHAPGHCPGQVLLFEPRKRWFFVADQILNTLAPNAWLHAGSEGDPLGDLLESLARMKGVDADLILPSHGMPERGVLRERVDEQIRYQQQYLAQVLGCVGHQGQTTWEVARRVSPAAALDVRQGPSVLSEVAAALVHLERVGCVIRTAEGLWIAQEGREAQLEWGSGHG